MFMSKVTYIKYQVGFLISKIGFISVESSSE